MDEEEERALFEKRARAHHQQLERRRLHFLKEAEQQALSAAKQSEWLRERQKMSYEQREREKQRQRAKEAHHHAHESQIRELHKQIREAHDGTYTRNHWKHQEGEYQQRWQCIQQANTKCLSCAVAAHNAPPHMEHGDADSDKNGEQHGDEHLLEVRPEAHALKWK